MYMDHSIKLRDDLPPALLRDFKELQEFYDQGNWFDFDLMFEAVQATVKAYYHNGKISRGDLDMIFRKYG